VTQTSKPDTVSTNDKPNEAIGTDIPWTLGEPPHRHDIRVLCWVSLPSANRADERLAVLWWGQGWNEEEMWEWDDNENSFWGKIIAWCDINPPHLSVLEQRRSSVAARTAHIYTPVENGLCSVCGWTWGEYCFSAEAFGRL
jgi:hypothetical protein